MSVNVNQARALCTTTEFALYEASRPENVKQHSPAMLKSKIRRARAVRDKYQDLYKRQRLSTRARTGSKKGNFPERNARTEQKAKLFAEVLERLQKQDDRLSAAAAKAEAKAKARSKAQASAKAKAPAKKKAPAKTRARAKAAPASKKAAAKRKAGYVSGAAASANQRQQLRKTRSKAVAGHTRSAGKRSQARRDSR